MARLAPCPHCDDLESQCSQLRRSLEQLRAAEDGKFAALQRVLGREIARRLDAEAECVRLKDEIGAPHDEKRKEADPQA
jgi:hypothetical protein